MTISAFIVMILEVTITPSVMQFTAHIWAHKQFHEN